MKCKSASLFFQAMGKPQKRLLRNWCCDSGLIVIKQRRVKFLLDYIRRWTTKRKLNTYIFWHKYRFTTRWNCREVLFLARGCIQGFNYLPLIAASNFGRRETCNKKSLWKFESSNNPWADHRLLRKDDLAIKIGTVLPNTTLIMLDRNPRILLRSSPFYFTDIFFACARKVPVIID